LSEFHQYDGHEVEQQAQRIHSYKPSSLALSSLDWYTLSVHFLGTFALQPRLHALVLSIEVGHVHDKVFHHEHVGQRSDGALVAYVWVHPCEASKAVAPVDIHGAASADTFSARPPEGKSRVLLVLDLQEDVKYHRAAVVQVNLVRLHAWLVTEVGIPPVDFEFLQRLLLWRLAVA